MRNLMRLRLISRSFYKLWLWKWVKKTVLRIFKRRINCSWMMRLRTKWLQRKVWRKLLRIWNKTSLSNRFSNWSSGPITNQFRKRTQSRKNLWWVKLNLSKLFRENWTKIRKNEWEMHWVVFWIIYICS